MCQGLRTAGRAQPAFPSFCDNGVTRSIGIGIGVGVGIGIGIGIGGHTTEHYKP